jgi:hypothetical protein
MISVLLTADQIRSAPPQIRNWFRELLEHELTVGRVSAVPPSRALAKCSVDEAALILEHIQSDYLACQVFFELGREEPVERTHFPDLHRISVQEIMHHVRLGDVHQLAACLEQIGEAFRVIRSDPEATLFAFDDMGGCYIDQTTRQSIRSVWETLVTERLRNVSENERLATPIIKMPLTGGGQARSDNASPSDSL